jgi:hypothetical protein
MPDKYPNITANKKITLLLPTTLDTYDLYIETGQEIPNSINIPSSKILFMAITYSPFLIYLSKSPQTR